MLFYWCLIDYTEAPQQRAATPAEFRLHLSFKHQVITLQHLNDDARGGLQPQALFCSFLDVKAAYARIP